MEKQKTVLYAHPLQMWLRENNVDEMDLTFGVDFEILGQVVHSELKTGGDQIKVTDLNKEEYIRYTYESPLFKIYFFNLIWLLFGLVTIYAVVDF